MHKGSCLCRSVTYEIGAVFFGRYCHCTNCRKFSGTSPAAWAAADATTFKLTSDAGHISKYATDTGRRCFCSKCGSPLWYESSDMPEVMGIPLGVLDEGNIPNPEMHVWTQSKVPWCDAADDLPAYETHP